MTRILLADDHSFVRAVLKQIISSLADMVVVDEVGSADEALDEIRKNSYSVVVLDISMPGKSGMDALKEIKNEFPGLPVLMLSMYPEDQYAMTALGLGAAGYMTKDRAPEELVNALRTVAEGGKYISPALSERLAFKPDVDAGKNVREMFLDRGYGVFRPMQS
jgi:two-component system invasion response regulator UvrY